MRIGEFRVFPSIMMQLFFIVILFNLFFFRTALSENFSEILLRILGFLLRIWSFFENLGVF